MGYNVIYFHCCNPRSHSHTS